MKARSVQIGKDGIVKVPLSRDGKQEATISLEDYQELISLGMFQNWALRGGVVGACGPGNVRVIVSRVLLDAKPGQTVEYKDGDKSNLLRENLSLREGYSVHHDRDLLIQSVQEASEKKILAEITKAMEEAKLSEQRERIETERPDPFQGGWFGMQKRRQERLRRKPC